MIKLRGSEAAASSIVEQADYYKTVAVSDLARRGETAVDASINSLLELPERGSICRFQSSALGGLRWIPVPGFPKHMVFYRYIPEEPSVLIVQVLYGARDLGAILNPEE